MCLQLVLIVVAGITIVVRLPVWAFADERAHAAYVDQLGSGQLPVLGVDRVPTEIATAGGQAHGLAAMSYEAFQPPLYYAVAGVVWDPAYAIGGTAFAVRAVRFLDLLCLFVAVFLLWLLSRRIARTPAEAWAAFAVALTFVAWPGVVFRAVTIGNSTLELPLTVGAILALWIAWNERSGRALISASVICGLGLLCRVPFPAVLLLPVVAWRLRHRSTRMAVAAVLLPAVILLPWLIDNLHRYGALTAASVVRQMQGGFLNPGDRAYGLTRLAHTDVTLLNGVLPEEWSNTTLFLYQSSHSLPLSVLHATRIALGTLIGVPFLLWIVGGPRRLWLLIAPLLLALILMQLDTIAIRLPLIQPRYAYPALTAFGLAAGFILIRRAGYAVTVITASCLTAALAAFWIYLAGIPTLAG